MKKKQTDSCKKGKCSYYNKKENSCLLGKKVNNIPPHICRYSGIII